MKDRNFRVTWTIDLNAASPEAAAERAREIHRDWDSIASVFDVSDENETWVVDLLALGRRRIRLIDRG